METSNADTVLNILEHCKSLTINKLSSQSKLAIDTVLKCLDELRNRKVIISLSNVAEGVLLVELQNS
jgi:hypothetical protein